MFQLDDGTICVINLKNNCQTDVGGLQPSTDALHKDYKFIYSRIVLFLLLYQTTCAIRIWIVNNIPTMQFFSGISKNTQSKSYMLALTECIWVHGNSKIMRCAILIHMPYYYVILSSEFSIHHFKVHDSMLVLHTHLSTSIYSCDTCHRLML